MGHDDSGIVSYIRGALYIEFIVLSFYWIALFIAITVAGLYHELLPLLVVGLHFAAPFAALDMLAFVEERHAKTVHPSTSEMARWVAQSIGALVTDCIGLTYAIGTFHEAYASEESIGVANIVFLALLVASTAIVSVCMIIFWVRHDRSRDSSNASSELHMPFNAVELRAGLHRYNA